MIDSAMKKILKKYTYYNMGKNDIKIINKIVYTSLTRAKLN